MSEKRLPLEHLHADAVCEDMPPCDAILVFTGKGGEVLNELKRLYPQTHSRIYYIEDTLNTRLPGILSDAAKLHIPCLVMYGNETLRISDFLQGEAPRISVISRGTEDPDPVYSFLKKTSPDYLAWIGFQRYLTDPAILELLNDKYLETMRLGVFRENLAAAEPLLREASSHFIDLRSVRHADAPEGNDTHPNGLYAEEICTLARYAGLSRHFRMAVLYGYPAKCSRGSRIARLNAQIIWHLTEGLAVSVDEHPGEENVSFQRKAVQMGEDGQEIVFFQSKNSGRWWMEVPNSKQPDNPVYISCTMEDYTIACKGEVPLKWLFYYQKSNNFS